MKLTAYAFLSSMKNKTDDGRTTIQHQMQAECQ